MYQQRQSQEQPVTGITTLDTMMSHAPRASVRWIQGKILWRTRPSRRCSATARSELQQLTVAENQPSGRLADQHCALRRPSSGESVLLTQGVALSPSGWDRPVGRVTVTLILATSRCTPTISWWCWRTSIPSGAGRSSSSSPTGSRQPLRSHSGVRCRQPHHLGQSGLREDHRLQRGREACGQRPSMLKSGLHDQTFYVDMYPPERGGIGVGRCGTSARMASSIPSS